MSWNRVLVTGATSAIGKALAERLAKDGCNLVLMARDSDEIERVISDLRIRWPIEVEAMSFDATDIESNQSLISDMTRAGDLDNRVSGETVAAAAARKEDHDERTEQDSPGRLHAG